MSIKVGNEYARKGLYDKAISEYRKVEKESPLYSQAMYNIDLLMSKLDEIQKEQTRTNELKILDNPKLSIIMPVFNVDPYLEASILSVINQPFRDFEFIIVNDASTDGSINTIKMFAKLDPRVKIIDLEANTLGGAGIPSNVGIKAARGKYIGFVDSDDFISRNAFQLMVETAEKFEADIIISDFSRVDQNTKEVSGCYDIGYWRTIPKNKVFNANDVPNVFRISPVPWRKLYNKEFLDKHRIGFAEGDFFYEDNPLHWNVLLHAKRIVAVDSVSSFHRMAREGQTMGAAGYKFASVFMHINSTRVLMENKSNFSQVAWRELADQLWRTDWLYNDPDPKVKKLLQHLYARLCDRFIESKHITIGEMNKIRPTFEQRYKENKQARKDVDLTIIIPLYNAREFIEQTLQTFEIMKKIKFDVMVVDDGSTDGSSEIARRICESKELFYYFNQKNRGAGRARNSVIPLANGKYTYFFDADDVVYPEVLEEAVLNALKSNVDLTLMPYKHLNHKNSGISRGEMFPTDVRLWSELRAETDVEKRRKIISGMGNYPWNRIIKTDLLHDDLIFFGGSIVHNDIKYHWHSLCAAKKIDYLDKVICDHRLFETRQQITAINDERRLLVFSALEETFDTISKYQKFAEIAPIWKEFATKLISWAEGRIDVKHKHTFASRKKTCESKIFVL